MLTSSLIYWYADKKKASMGSRLFLIIPLVDVTYLRESMRACATHRSPKEGVDVVIVPEPVVIVRMDIYIILGATIPSRGCSVKKSEREKEIIKQMLR